MYEVEETFHFEAGHQLVHHDGKCSQPHGHSYILTIQVRSETLQTEGPKKNMLVDFDDIRKAVKPMIEDYFDHHWLNDSLETDSPTSEFIARWIYRFLKPRLPNLSCVMINETCTSAVRYWEE